MSDVVNPQPSQNEKRKERDNLVLVTTLTTLSKIMATSNKGFTTAMFAIANTNESCYGFKLEKLIKLLLRIT